MSKADALRKQQLKREGVQLLALSTIASPKSIQRAIDTSPYESTAKTLEAHKLAIKKGGKSDA